MDKERKVLTECIYCHAPVAYHYYFDPYEIVVKCQSKECGAEFNRAFYVIKGHENSDAGDFTYHPNLRQP